MPIEVRRLVGSVSCDDKPDPNGSVDLECSSIVPAITGRVLLFQCYNGVIQRNYRGINLASGNC